MQKPCLSDPAEKRCRTADKVGYACYGCIGPKFPLSKPLFKFREAVPRAPEHSPRRRPSGDVRRTIRMDLNRVEGDMEVRLELDGHTVTDAWCVGTMFRGFEQILVGRDPGDALVIAPRICGICTTSQLYAAASALETAYRADRRQRHAHPQPLPHGGVGHERRAPQLPHVHARLLQPAYADHPLYARVLELFEPPFKGRLARETVEHTKRILAIVIAFGGEWPHSTYMMPGGVTCALDEARLECAAAIDAYQAWYERSVLGCASEEWLALETAEDLAAWLEVPAHRDTALGVFATFATSIGLEDLGAGTPHLLSAGCYYDPERWQPPFEERPCLERRRLLRRRDGHDRAVLALRGRRAPALLAARRSRRPAPPVGERDAPRRRREEAYSFAKATRYKDHVVQLGPLADLVLAGDPLTRSLFAAQGPSTWLRQFTRLHRPVATLQEMRRTVGELRAHLGEPTYVAAEPRADGDGFGAINAARGSLGHWVRIRDGKIDNYQVITPTAWNGSPRDDAGRRGHWEESFVGLEIADLDNPVELFHVVRSHDACLVCTVHLARGRGALGASRSDGHDVRPLLGQRVARRRRVRPPRLPAPAARAAAAGVTLVDAGTAGLNALGWLDGCDKAVLVDAVRVGARVGTVHRLDASELESPGGELSLHELGLGASLAATRRPATPRNVVVIGAEVGPVHAFTDALSPPLRTAVPTAAAMVAREVVTS